MNRIPATPLTSAASTFLRPFRRWMSSARKMVSRALMMIPMPAPIADRPTQRARHQPDRVGDIGLERGVPEGEQNGEGDQRSGPNDGVDRPRRETRAQNGDRLNGAHGTDRAAFRTGRS